jgi:hypothetical protein
MRAAERQQHHHDLFERKKKKGWLEMEWDGMVVVIPGWPRYEPDS